MIDAGAYSMGGKGREVDLETMKTTVGEQFQPESGELTWAP